MTTTATTSPSRQTRSAGAPTAESSPQARRRTPARKASPTAAAEKPAAPQPAIEPQPAAEKQLPAESQAAPAKPESELVTWQDVPMPHIKMPVVHLAGPAARAVATNVRWTTRTVASAVPQPRQLLYYGGVGALAAFGILEWPVALAAAAGVWVATHTGRRNGAQGPAEPPQGEQRATARPTAAAR